MVLIPSIQTVERQIKVTCIIINKSIFSIKAGGNPVYCMGTACFLILKIDQPVLSLLNL
jgi:hypothetical protein